MSCTPLRFSRSNHVPLFTLSTNWSVTNLNHLKNQWASRVASFEAPTTDGDVIIINGASPDSVLRVCEYVALPDHGLSGLVDMRFTLYSSDSPSLDDIVYQTDWTRMAEYTPLGVWEAGYHPFGSPLDTETPGTYLHWLPKPQPYRSFRLEIRYSADAIAHNAVSDLRMMMIGEALKLDYSFGAGHELTRLTEPELVETASGSHIPKRFQRLRRVWQFRLPQMSPRDRQMLAEFETAQRTQPFIVSAFPDKEGFRHTDYSFLARFGSALPYGQRYSEIYNTAATAVEV